ncbi:apolipoprotein N-acyltransferase [Actinomycetospora sp. NBRC 106375]|uniref:apolipoprotein N-acyltransferase n=1 Tax=Actinomycetospora sp. NBRC 106375 TaxID=3032207 RepID=UPI0024A28F33|nr:apolipoprotein N-acyltransferase [Actinomycetospora sp. NBRC 106375]GLZ43880.1 apolipoprotein N-acyltransferase [Actinomycetospora sp. NBRC 106375]
MLTSDRKAPSFEGFERRGPSRGTWMRLAAAVAGGLALYVAFPPLGAWWAAPVGIALVLAAVDGRRLRSAFGLGLLVGVAYQWPLLHWTGEYVGAVWLLLLVALTLVVAVPVALMPLVARLPGGPFWVAGVWVAGEAVIERWPFAGFPWAKVAFGQPGGPFASLASLGGAPLVSFAVVLCGAGLWALVGALRPPRQGRVAAVALVAVLLGPVAGLATWPSVTASPPGPTITVAAVQGNVPRAGLDFNAQRRAVLDNHVAQTRRLADDVRAGRTPPPNLVIWPENSSDIDPIRNADAGAEIQAVTDEIGVPVVVGAVLSGTRAADGTIVQGPRNTAIVWMPRTGPAATYTKRHILPFGEYIPLRGVAELVSPLVDRVTDFEPGTGSGVLPAGPARLGVVTCYEVVFDDAVRDAVRGGADLLTVPTNNATFGYSDMTYQQQGMSRLRAIEHDRAVVIAATSGQSAVVAPDGSLVARTGALFTPGLLVETVPLRTTTTLATRLGPAPEWVLAGLGVAAVVAGAVVRRKRA